MFQSPPKKKEAGNNINPLLVSDTTNGSNEPKIYQIKKLFFYYFFKK